MADADTIVIRRYLQKLLSSELMEKSEASQRLLRYLAERALREETPKETEIAIDVFHHLVYVGTAALAFEILDRAG